MRPRCVFVLIVALVSTLGLAAGADATGTETRTPFTAPFENPCTGEPFTATGFVHITSDFTIGTDGSLHDQYHLNLEGVTAKGLVSGVKYVVEQEWNDGTNADDDHMTMHHIFKEHYVRAREDGTPVVGAAGDDFYVYFHLHITVNANGTPTAFTLNTEDEPCQ